MGAKLSHSRFIVRMIFPHWLDQGQNYKIKTKTSKQTTKKKHRLSPQANLKRTKNKENKNIFFPNM